MLRVLRSRPRRRTRRRALAGYFTDGSRLLHVVPLARDPEGAAAVEDCRTLEVRVMTDAELRGLGLRFVAAARGGARWVGT